MNIDGVVFDMDGVLVDATEWHYESLNRALALFGLEIEREQHLSTFDGLPTRRKLEIISQDRPLPVGLHSFINELKQIYTVELIHTACRPTFTHQNALKQLKLAGYRLAVASNSIRDTVELMMHKTRLDVYLDAIVSASDIDKGKPDPLIYLTAVSRLGLEARACLAVEDNAHGVEAAVAAGLSVLHVRMPSDVTAETVKNAIETLRGISAPRVITVGEVA